MAEIRSIDHIAKKWARVTPQRRPDYEFGVNNPRRDWAEAAAAADGTWKEAITAAAASGRFGKGVKKAGTAKWKSRTIQKGPSRFDGLTAHGFCGYSWCCHRLHKERFRTWR